MSDFNCILVLGPTASGKTKLACRIAYELNGEIISADSRQVYKELTIGTGKDLFEYLVNGKKIDHHLIDICEPERQYFLHEYIRDSKTAFLNIKERGKLPVICGGSGLYLDSYRKDFSLTQIPESPDLRASLEHLPLEELTLMLMEKKRKELEHVDLNSRKRVIRALEISAFLEVNQFDFDKKVLPYRPYYVGIRSEASKRRLLIEKRLEERIEQGMIEEVEQLLHKGMTYERLQFLGLEYKFISFYLQNKMDMDEMKEKLLTAILQFSKRQMTWFRRMEKEGVNIHWIELDFTEEFMKDLKTIFTG